MRHKWRWLSVGAVIAVAATIGAGLGLSTHEEPAGPASSYAGVHGREGTPEAQMLAAHQQMTEQMRVAATSAMVQMMNADPMWAQMRTDPFIREQEENQREIDKMLGRGG